MTGTKKQKNASARFIIVYVLLCRRLWWWNASATFINVCVLPCDQRMVWILSSFEKKTNWKWVQKFMEMIWSSNTAGVSLHFLPMAESETHLFSLSFIWCVLSAQLGTLGFSCAVTCGFYSYRWSAWLSSQGRKVKRFVERSPVCLQASYLEWLVFTLVWSTVEPLYKVVWPGVRENWKSLGKHWSFLIIIMIREIYIALNFVKRYKSMCFHANRSHA